MFNLRPILLVWVLFGQFLKDGSRFILEVCRDVWHIWKWPAVNEFAEVLLVLHIAKAEEVLSDAHKATAIANGLSVADVPAVVEEGAHGPIWNLSDAFAGLLDSKG